MARRPGNYMLFGDIKCGYAASPKSTKYKFCAIAWARTAPSNGDYAKLAFCIIARAR